MSHVTTNYKTKIQYYDNLRAVACFLVILTHSAMPAVNASFGVFMVLFSLIASPSSELFVSISSGLLAPTKLSMKRFYIKRFSKLLWPFLFWSIFMVLYRYFNSEINMKEAIERILLFPIKPTEGVYWFVYAICGLYIINPIISPWLQKTTKKELQFILSLWALTLLMPYLNIISGKEIYKINGNYYFILTYVGGFVGYMLLGVYFKMFPIFIKSKVKLFLVILALLSLGTAPILWSYIFNKSVLETVYNNLSITSALYVSAIYIFFKNFTFSNFINKWFSIIATYSFGIYLIHILIVRELVWRVLENNRLPHPLIETPFIAITSLFICLGVVKLLSYLPKSKYIVGV